MHAYLVCVFNPCDRRPLFRIIHIIYEQGFTFLKIPRSYYGVLTIGHLTHGGQPGATQTQPTLSPSCASAVMDACERTKITTPDAAVDLTLSRDEISLRLHSAIDHQSHPEFHAHTNQIIDSILTSRYSNLYGLLGDAIPTDQYIAIIRNQILVDVQGQDILFQIFTSNVLQRRVGEEAPFFEFIQRVCSACDDNTPIKPGCGGFGIRNFLTLFLSIEVGKAMVEASNARAEGDAVGVERAGRRVELFTEQLDESNPILTEIADAMTGEGEVLARIRRAERGGDGEVVERLTREMEVVRAAKEVSNRKLMDCSAKYNELMRSLRLSGR